MIDEGIIMIAMMKVMETFDILHVNVNDSPAYANALAKELNNFAQWSTKNDKPSKNNVVNFPK